MHFRARLSLLPTGKSYPYGLHPLYPKWVDYPNSRSSTKGSNHTTICYFVTLQHDLSAKGDSHGFHIFARRQQCVKGMTYLGNVQMSLTPGNQQTSFENCIQQAVHCALTAMVNAQFCYLFTVTDLELNALTKPQLMTEHSAFYHNLKDSRSPGSILLQGELLDCQYNKSSLQPLPSSTLPFQFTLDPRAPGHWKTYLEPIWDDSIKIKRAYIFNHILDHLKMRISPTARQNFTALSEACLADFNETYGWTIGTIVRQPIPAPPVTAPPPLPAPTVCEPPPLKRANLGIIQPPPAASSSTDLDDMVNAWLSTSPVDDTP